VTGWSYDLAGRLLRKTYHDGTHVDYTHDAAGRLATRQWARGITTTYAYNLRDQVTGTTYSDGTPAVTMSYDPAGRPLEIGNAVATDAYAYDDAGQLAVETQSVAGHPAAMRTLKYSHDAISGDPLKTLARMTARDLLSRRPQRKRSERADGVPD
jgi:YD repeat-containing protein